MRKEIVKTICSNCGKTFEDWEYRKRKYCTFRCYQKSRPKKIERQCLNCKKIFKTYENKGRVYCSTKCMYTDEKWKEKQRKQTHTLMQREKWSKKNIQMKRWVGENNPHYKHGLGTLRSIIKRDANGICTLCKKGMKDIPSFLDLHHKNMNHQDNKKENLIAVCPNCHRKEHLKQIEEKYKYKKY